MRGTRPLALAAGGALGAHWSPAVAAVLPGTGSLFGIPTTVVDGEVLLTFDDGPHPEGTPAVLAELDRVGTSAVFFASGEQAVRYPELVREVAAAGHELGLHGYRHQTRRQWSRGLLAADLRRARDAVSAAAGVEPRLYRPPHGVFSLAGLRLSSELGLEPLLWSKWGRDWERRATPESITARVTEGIRPGDVVLLHDADHYSAPGSWQRTAAAIGPIAKRIADEGLRLMATLADIRGDGPRAQPAGR